MSFKLQGQAAGQVFLEFNCQLLKRISFSLDDTAVLKNIVKEKQLNSELLNFSGDWLRVGLSWLEKLMIKALGNRVDMLTIWPVTFPEVHLLIKTCSIKISGVELVLFLSHLTVC